MTNISTFNAVIWITWDVAESIGKSHRTIWGTTKRAFSKTWAKVTQPSVKPSASLTRYPRPGTSAKTPVDVRSTSSKTVLAELIGVDSCTIW